MEEKPPLIGDNTQGDNQSIFANTEATKIQTGNITQTILEAQTIFERIEIPEIARICTKESLNL